jgi:hypothetical protein
MDLDSARKYSKHTTSCPTVSSLRSSLRLCSRLSSSSALRSRERVATPLAARTAENVLNLSKKNGDTVAHSCEKWTNPLDVCRCRPCGVQKFRLFVTESNPHDYLRTSAQHELTACRGTWRVFTIVYPISMDWTWGCQTCHWMCLSSREGGTLISLGAGACASW